MRLRTLILLSAVTLAVTACDPNAARRQTLNSDLQRLSGDYSILSQSVSARTARLSDTERRMQAQQSELTDYRRRVNAFMMNHKMAVAALAIGAGGAAVALDSENEFSSDAKALGGIAAIFAVAYAIDNAQEIADVADQLFQADRYVKELERQIAETTSARDAESQQLTQESNSLRELQLTVANVRAELEQLQ